MSGERQLAGWEITYPDPQLLKETARKYVREFVSWCGQNIPFEDPILDFACGYRNNRPEIDPQNIRQFISLDLNFALKPDIVGDVQSAGIASKSFGCVLCTEMLEHVLSPQAVLSEAHRILKPGGLFIATVPFWVPIHEKTWQQDYWRFTPRGLTTLLETNFVNVVTFSKEQGLFPISVLAHCRKP